MNESCRFTKNGLMCDGKTPRGIIHLLNAECEIDPEVTLLDFFMAVEQHPALMEFIANYSWCKHIYEFHKQIKQPCEQEQSDNYLEIYRTGQIYKYGNDGDFLETYCEWHMVNPNNEDGPWSISYSPLNEICHLPVKLNRKYEIYKMDASIDKPVLVVNQGFTLLEVLNTVYYDISFHGGPDDNKKFLEEMAETVEKIKSGELKTESFDSVKEMIDSLKINF